MILEFGILVLVFTPGLWLESQKVHLDSWRWNSYTMYGAFSLLFYMLIYVICHCKYGY